MNKKLKINWFWIAYLVFIALLLVLLSTACSKKTNPATWSYHKKVANQHPKLKVISVIHCNRE